MAFDFPSNTSKNYLQTVNQNAPDASSALKVLSLNLPSFLGGSPIAPDALLRPGLSTSAQVGGSLAAPPAPSAPGTSPSISSPALGPTTPPPPNSVSPFSTAPITQLTSNALAPPTSPTNTPPPAIQFPQVPTNRPDIGTGQAPNPLAALIGNTINPRGPLSRQA